MRIEEPITAKVVEDTAVAQPGRAVADADDQFISVVTAAYNEATNVDFFYREVRKYAPLAEIIFVDDGSSDGTADCVRRLHKLDARVRLVRLSRNFGNQAAFVAGLRAARGEAVITMDCDLQHSPSLLPRMLQAWRGGADVVQMVRRSNTHTSYFNRLTSRWFARLLAMLTDVPLSLGTGDFKLLSRRAVDLLLQYAHLSRPFYRAMPAWLGLPTVTIAYDAELRRSGEPRIGFLKRLELSLDTITTLSLRPLRLAFLLSAGAIALCLAYVLATLVAFFVGYTVRGYPTLVVLIVFLAAVQLFTVGIIGEYVGRVHERSRGLPPFVIAEEHAAVEPVSLTAKRKTA